MIFRLCLAFVAGLVGFRAGAAASIEVAARYQPVGEARGRAAEAARLKMLFEIDWAVQLDLYPELATYFGVPGYGDRWSDLSRAAHEARRAQPAAARDALRSIDRARLSPADQLSYDLFQRDVELALAGQAFPSELLPLTQLGGVQQDAARLMALAPRATVGDLEDQLQRLQALPALIDQTIAWMEEGMRRGIVHPRVVLREVPQQVRNQIVEEPLDSPLLVAFRSPSAGVAAEEQERLQRAAVAAYREEIAPAWRRLEQFLEERYLPAARESIGWNALPDGEAWYAHAVRERTTTDLSPEEIHQIGLAEVARVRAEMERVKRDAGFDGSLDEYFTFLRTDPQFYFTDRESLLQAYRDIAKRADAALPRLFGLLPRLPYGVAAVPAYAEKAQTTAYYEPGTLAGGRAGMFFANTYALETRPKWEMEALTLHEAVPGHHLQIALQQELEDLPPFRRFSWGLTGYVEGWGLYAESLGAEMGFYTDPHAHFGQLTYEMWRAIRLVVDTGMHAKGWSRQQAIEYFLAHAGKTENDIVVEIDRYIVWPGQALAYKLGELKLKELRRHASEHLGARFDLRRFHDEVLHRGPLPLDVLDRLVRQWVARQHE